MLSIYKYIRDFYQKELSLAYLLVVLLLLGTYIYLNYWHSLENRFAGSDNANWSNFLGHYLLYLIPFATAFLLQLLFYKNCSYYQSGWFWLILLMAPAFFSLRVNFNFQEILIEKIWNADAQIFWKRCLNWIIRALIVLIPVFIIWWVKDKSNQPFYGTAALKDVKPYLLMLLIMVPLIALASTQNDFLQMYPRAKFIAVLDLPQKKWHYLLYELCYGFDFVSIEFFFRGFLILSLYKICGSHCIIPVACFYCSIHFGKPMGEAISSFWGGLLLGIISFNTKSIWGGLIAHLGIAWLMETGSWIGMLLKK